MKIIMIFGLSVLLISLLDAMQDKATIVFKKYEDTTIKTKQFEYKCNGFCYIVSKIKNKNEYNTHPWAGKAMYVKSIQHHGRYPFEEIEIENAKKMYQQSKNQFKYQLAYLKAGIL